MGNRRWLAGIVFPIVMLAASTMKSVAADRFPWPFVLQLDQQSPTLVSGTVVNPVGQPVANANVAVFVEHPDFLVPVLSPTVLQQTVADGEGRFSMQFASPTPYQCSRLRAIAGHPNYGFCWMELVLTNREQKVHFHLKNERLVHGRAIGPDGKPIAGLRIHLRYFRDGASSVSLWPADAVPAAWPKSVLTDDAGEFSMRGIPSSEIEGALTFEADDERFAPQKTNVQTGGDEAVTMRLSPAGINTNLNFREVGVGIFMNTHSLGRDFPYDLARLHGQALFSHCTSSAALPPALLSTFLRFRGPKQPIPLVQEGLLTSTFAVGAGYLR